MKLLHLITTIERGGAENQLAILCKEQISLGYEVWVVYLKGNPELFEDFHKQGVKVVSFVNFTLLSQIFHLKKLVRTNCFDLIHAHLPRSELLASLAFTNIPIIISRHNSERFLPRGPASLSKFLSRFCLSRSSSRIAISKSVLDFLEISQEKSNKHLFDIVYYGFQFQDLDFKPSQEELSQHVKILSIGRLVTQKDFSTFLRGLSFLKLRNISFHASIVGAGNLESELKELSHNLGIDGNLSWRGRTKNTRAVYLDSDLFVLTSLYEGFGLVLVEAINFGLPIVCSRFAAALEVLGTDYSGFFEIGNAEELSLKIEWAIHNRSHLIYQLEKRKSLFDSVDMAKQIDNIYKNVLK